MSNLDKFAWAALSSRETLQATYDLAAAVISNGVPGDFVECGVFAGAQCAAMATALMEGLNPGNHRDSLLEYRIAEQERRNRRRVHLFDSFDGIPAGGPHDIGWTHPAGQSACDYDKVLNYMRDWGIDQSLLAFHAGPFEKTLPRAWTYDPLPVTKIAILRVDCDLYESTKLVLEHLYPLVVPGGWVIFDDYALPGARKAIEEYFQGAYSPMYMQRQP